MYNDFMIENKVSFSNNDAFKDVQKVEDSLKSIRVKIEAARAGRINGNLVFYTPKAMTQGMESYLRPFKKHLQDQHNGEAVGVIEETEYVTEFFPKASKKFLDIVSRINKASEASNSTELVKAVKELTQTDEYRDPEYRGLGIANVFGDIYQPKMIYDIKHRASDKGAVSIGGKSSEIYCSICSERVNKDHIHERGRIYNDETCFYINNDLILDHCGFVTTPADKLTKTEVVEDSQDSFLSLDVINYKTHSENTMTFEELKAKAKDSEAVKGLIKDLFTDEVKSDLAFEKYQKAIKNSRPNHYLVGEGSILNMRTPVGIYVAEHLVEQLPDDEEAKEYLTTAISNAKQTLKIENIDVALEEFLSTDTKKEPENVAKVVEPKEDEKGMPLNDPVTAVEPIKVTDELIQAIQNAVQEALAPVLEVTSKVQDNQNSNLTSELNSLRSTLEADETVIEGLKGELKSSRIQQIIAAKGGSVSEEYKAKLESRSIEELKLTLEDLTEQKLEHQADKEIDKGLQTVTEGEAVAKVEDRQQDIPTVVEETKEEPETTEDVKVEDSIQDPAIWLRERAKEVGYAKASREFKIKFSK